MSIVLYQHTQSACCCCLFYTIAKQQNRLCFHMRVSPLRLTDTGQRHTPLQLNYIHFLSIWSSLKSVCFLGSYCSESGLQGNICGKGNFIFKTSESFYFQLFVKNNNNKTKKTWLLDLGKCRLWITQCNPRYENIYILTFKIKCVSLGVNIYIYIYVLTFTIKCVSLGVNICIYICTYFHNQVCVPRCEYIYMYLLSQSSVCPWNPLDFESYYAHIWLIEKHAKLAHTRHLSISSTVS